MSKSMDELIANLVSPVAGKAPRPCSSIKGKVKPTNLVHELLFISKVLCFIMICSIHHSENLLLGKAVQ